MVDVVQTSFEEALNRHGQWLEREAPRVLQLNVGKMCNLACVHCHVGAGPSRTEMMTRETMSRIQDWVEENPVPVVDITGGAPEMFPMFQELVAWLTHRGMHVMDRCNLTILLQPGYERMAEFLKVHRVEIVASMPCYSPENVNAQRGNGVFDQSIEALRLLNDLGYGVEDAWPLHLVYNPNGAFLPPDQEELERDYKRELDRHFGIRFHQLFAMTNLPVSRFATYLKRRGSYEEYLQLLKDHFNPGSVAGLMCRDTISVDWMGRVFDCDFNQQMEMHTGFDHEPQYLWDLDLRRWKQTPIRTAPHCFGCTAGQGSSCGGALG